MLRAGTLHQLGYPPIALTQIEPSKTQKPEHPFGLFVWLTNMFIRCIIVVRGLERGDQETVLWKGFRHDKTEDSGLDFWHYHNNCGLRSDLSTWRYISLSCPAHVDYRHLTQMWGQRNSAGLDTSFSRRVFCLQNYSLLILLASNHASSNIFFMASAISALSIIMPSFSRHEAIMILLS